MTRIFQYIFPIIIICFILVGCSKVVGEYEVKLNKGSSTVILYEDLTFKQIGSIWEQDSDIVFNGNWKYLDKEKKIIETITTGSLWKIWTMTPATKYKIENNSLIILKDK
jgi:hypothetical protein